MVKLVVARYAIGAVVFIFDSEVGTGGEAGQAGETDRILLLRQPPGKGWTLPAGLLGRFEAPIDGACREAEEETGIQLTPDQLTPAEPNAIVHTKGHWVDVVFTARVPASTTELSIDGAEVWEAAWHCIDQLPKLTPATERLLSLYGMGPSAEPAPAAAP